MSTVPVHRQTPLGRWSDRWWTLVAPGYAPAVALVGWHRALDELVADIDGVRVLDVGCGPAYVADGLLARGVGYVGLDRNEAMLERARRRLTYKTGSGALVRADVTALPFPDRSFDVVLSAAVLGLLDLRSRRAALHELARVTRREVRLLEPVHRPGEPLRLGRAHVVALVRDAPLELSELVDAGLEPRVHGQPHLAGVYAQVRATRR